MADDPRLAALAGAILPWVVMPTGGGRYAGADWTPEEQAAYDDAGGWGAGIDAARRVRAERAARDALAALDGDPDAWEWGIRAALGWDPLPCIDESHARSWTPPDVGAAIDTSGWEVVRRRPASTWEPAPAPADPTSEEHRP